MSGDPYRREAYGIERRVRAPTPEEAARIDEGQRDWREQVRKQESSVALELIVPTFVSLAALAFGLWKWNEAVMVVAGGMSAFFAWLTVIATRASKRRIEAARGPWHPPDGTTWQVEETHVRARSIVAAVSDDEDYGQWVLFEVPGSDWLYLDAWWLEPLSSSRAGLAKEHVTLTRLHPHGRFLALAADGAPIPARGAALGSGDDYARDLEHGFVWRPEDGAEDEEGDAIGVVSEASLPAWIRSRD